MKLKSKSPFIDVEIFSEALRRGARIRQYGLIFDLRTKGHSSISRMAVVARTFWDMLPLQIFAALIGETMKRLIISADDFGLAHSINEGILMAVREVCHKY